MKLINEYIDSLFAPTDTDLEDVLTSIEENGMRSISVSPGSGKLLTMLVSLSQAKEVLEIGALGGYSGICLARGFCSEGYLTSLELEENYAALAHQNLTKAGFGNQVTYLTGPALESLQILKENNKQYDFFFIDADKLNYINYLNACIELAKDGAIIVTDNVLAGGSVADPNAQPKRYSEFMKEYNQTVSEHSQLQSVLIPIGDGMTVSRVIK